MTYDGNPHPFGWSYASKYPRKAAQYLSQIEQRGPADEREQRLVVGLADCLRELKRCLRCGAPLKNKNQPGYAESIGPECWSKQGRAAS